MIPDDVIKAAQASQREWQVPTSVTIAQWAQESGWGKSMPAGSNNPFGIKAVDDEPYVLADTFEYKNGKRTRIKAKFRKYDTITDAFADHARLLAESPAYASAKNFINNPLRFADALRPYATDPSYVEKIKAIIRKNNLQKYDLPWPYVKDVSSIQGVLNPWTMRDLCAAYKWPASAPGNGIIAIVELGGGWVQSDIDQFFSSAQLPSPAIADISVDGTGNSPPSGSVADSEVALDIQVAAAAYSIATGRAAKIRVYWARDIASAVRAATNDGCDVCSISWGGDESSWEAQDASDMETAATEATAAGMVVFAASGDNDSSDGGQTPANVDLPSSAPHVIGCGGTTKTVANEIVWNEDPGNASGHGTGGGFSTIFSPMPLWQAGAPHGPGRMVPDVAGDADGRTGYRIIVGGQEKVLGGTSAVAPLYAGLFASFGEKLGFVTPKLWLNHLCFTDIQIGDNGAFRARMGPDACTGLGSPIGVKLLELFRDRPTLQAQIAAIAPREQAATPWMDWMRAHRNEVQQTGAVPTEFTKRIFAHTNYGPLHGYTPESCAATVCAALEETGFKSTKSAAAASYITYGQACELKPGCIIVFEWSTGQHHVDFCDQIIDHDNVLGLGGNQGHRLQDSRFPRRFIIATRWPVPSEQAPGAQPGVPPAPRAQQQVGSYTVRQGHRYRATISLGFLENWAANDLIAAKLTAVGFADVVVAGEGSSRTAEATWTGPETTAPIDSHITNIVEIAAA